MLGKPLFLQAICLTPSDSVKLFKLLQSLNVSSKIDSTPFEIVTVFKFLQFSNDPFPIHFHLSLQTLWSA